MRLILAALLLHAASSFAAYRETTYSTADGTTLRFAIAAPSLDASARFPTWIFVAGDGTILDSFDTGQSRAQMEALAQAFGIAIVTPELRRQVYASDLKRYCELDFFHRISDLSDLVDVVQTQPFVDAAGIILFAHSAGGEIATLLAQRRTGIRGVATYGTGVVSAGELGSTPIDPRAFANDCTDPQTYSRRSGQFWTQLFLESRLDATIRASRVPYLAMFGGADTTVPFDERQSERAARLAHDRPGFTYEVFPGLTHGDFSRNPAIFQRVWAWAR